MHARFTKHKTWEIRFVLLHIYHTKKGSCRVYMTGIICGSSAVCKTCTESIMLSLGTWLLHGSAVIRGLVSWMAVHHIDICVMNGSASHWCRCHEMAVHHIDIRVMNGSVSHWYLCQVWQCIKLIAVSWLALYHTNNIFPRKGFNWVSGLDCAQGLLLYEYFLHSWIFEPMNRYVLMSYNKLAMALLLWLSIKTSRSYVWWDHGIISRYLSPFHVAWCVGLT